MTPLAALSPGDRIGRYVVERRLGAGGMGEVWQAVLHGPRGFRRAVALKVLHPGRLGPEDEEALVREARLGALVHHPNVVSVLELGCEGDRWFVAMDLVRGDSLAAWLRRQGPLEPAAILDLGVQVCAGLGHLHGLAVDGTEGLVHRDVKPGNLLLDPLGTVRVADLGIAGVAGRDRSTAGTPGYAPPEQVAGLPVDGRADLFALGRTLAVAALGAAGREPGAAEPLEARLRGLGAVIARATAPAPGDRFPTAEAFEVALRALRDGAPGRPLRLLVAAAAPSPEPAPTPGESGPVASLPSRTPSPEVARALAPLAVFAGGFTAEAADAVVGAGARDRLAALVTDGWVSFDPQRGRYGLPAAVLGALPTAGLDPALLRRHAAWYAQLGADEAVRSLSRDPEAVAALVAERENVGLAIDRAVDLGDGASAAAAARAWVAIVERVGPVGAAVPQLEKVLPVAPRRWWSLLQVLLGTHLGFVGRLAEAEELLRTAVADARAAGDEDGLARALVALASELQRVGRASDAPALLDEAHRLARRRGDRTGVARALLRVGAEARLGGRGAAAVRAYEDAAAAAEADGNLQLAAIALAGLGDVLAGQERFAEGRAALERALLLARRFGLVSFVSMAARNLGWLESRAGRHEEAIRSLHEAVATGRASGAKDMLASALEDLGLALTAAGRPAEALPALREALDTFRANGQLRAVGMVLCTLSDALVDTGRGDEAADALAGALRVGREIASPRVEGRALVQRAELAVRAGDLAEAGRCADALAPLVPRLGDLLTGELADRWAAMRRALDQGASG